MNQIPAKEMKEIVKAEKLKEIIVEEKLHITEIEETIEADIPLPVEELTDIPKADGKCPKQNPLIFMKILLLSLVE